MNDIEILDAPAETANVEAAPAPEPDAAVTVETPEAPTLDESAAAAPAAADVEAAEPEPITVDYPEDEPDPAETEASPQRGEPESTGPAAKYGTGALSRMLKENPELAAAAEATPRVKSQLYQMARRSQELGRYQELIPSISRAQEAVEASRALEGFDRAYFGQEPEQFWRELYNAQVTHDPASGQARSRGVYERNVQFLHKVFLDRMEQQGGRDSNSDLLGAVQTLRDALGWTQSSPANNAPAAGHAAQAVSEANLPPQIRQKLTQAEQDARELQQLRARRSDEERRTQETFLDDTAREVADELRTFVDGLLANTRLSDYDRRNIGRDFIEEASKLADQDKVHNAALEEILRAGGHAPQTRAKLVSQAKSWARQNGRDILQPILARAGAGLRQRQAERAAVQQQQQRQRAEPAAAGAPANPRVPSARELVRAAESKLRRRMTDREILDLG